jgi:phospholipid/cholesterol/gamma-HCH transport system substrate-binding protein
VGHILQNTTVTSKTLIDQQGQLDGFLFQVTRAGYKGSDFFGPNADALVDVVHNLLPTTSLLNEYSPEFACVLQGVDKADKQMYATQSKVPGITGLVQIQPGDEPYKNPEQLTVINPDAGPHCYGLPNLDGRITPEEAVVNQDKGDPNKAVDNRLRPGDPPLVVQLFGPLAGVPLTPLEKAELKPGGLR